MNNIELILINITGNDRPGVTSALTDILARYDAQILDIGQADIHHSLSLGILFRTDSERSGDILKDLLFKCYELNVQIRFSPIAIGDYENWVQRQGKNRWIITILGRRLTARHIALVTDEIARQELNIDGIQRLTGVRRSARTKSPGQKPASNSPSEATPSTSQACEAASWKCRRPKSSTSPCKKTTCSAAAAASYASIWTPPSSKPRSSTNSPTAPA